MNRPAAEATAASARAMTANRSASWLFVKEDMVGFSGLGPSVRIARRGPRPQFSGWQRPAQVPMAYVPGTIWPVLRRPRERWTVEWRRLPYVVVADGRSFGREQVGE